MKKQDKKPFFARLLETQELEKVTGGAAASITKPSIDIDTTQKYPSDGDEAVL
ncbi:microviridin/marinostatin family tricyclic proteinase inhibitor [Myxococcaceae bacterium GXIMD 01537]